MTVHLFKQHTPSSSQTPHSAREMITTIGAVLLHLENMAASHDLTIAMAGLRYAQSMLHHELHAPECSESILEHARKSFSLLEEDLTFHDPDLVHDNIFPLRPTKQ